MTRALALLLTACASLPPTTRPARPDELAAVEAAHAAYVDARGPVALGALARVDVVPLSLEELRDACYAPALACVYTVERYVGAPLSTLIYVREDASEREHARLIIHEALHVIRATWAYEVTGDEYLARLRTGATEDCPIRYPDDRGHCDAAVWTSILDDAAQRIGAP